MCNRFRSLTNAAELAERYKVFLKKKLVDNPNAAPTEEVPIIALDPTGQRKLLIARFGLIPRHAKDVRQGYTLTNARVEKVMQKSAFREAYAKRRCIVPVEGYYEWREEHGHKQPYLFVMGDGSPMALAGLWDFAKINSQDVWSFTILTNEPNSLVKPIHDRMPCIVPNDRIDNWLDPKRGGIEQLELFPSHLMHMYAVDHVMNDSGVKNRKVINT